MNTYPLDQSLQSVEKLPAIYLRMQVTGLAGRLKGKKMHNVNEKLFTTGTVNTCYCDQLCNICSFITFSLTLLSELLSRAFT